MERILNVLSGDDAEILVLRYYLDLTVEDIAIILNLTVANVKIRLLRAGVRFREVMALEDASEDLRFGGDSMKLSDEELDKLIKEQIAWELQQIPAP